MRIEKDYGFVFWTLRAYDSKLLLRKKSKCVRSFLASGFVKIGSFRDVCCFNYVSDGQNNELQLSNLIHDLKYISFIHLINARNLESKNICYE
jgi:hypothetical protein